MSFPLDLPVHALCCDRQPPQHEALRFAWEDGRVERWSFGELAAASRALAQELRAQGVGPGDRVAVVLPQCPLGPALHLALSRLGAVSVPLSPLFGPDGLAPRLQAAQPRLAVAHASRAAAVREAMPALPIRVTAGDLPRAGTAALEEEHARGGDAPWTLMFTSGTTATPKAALLPHRVIAGRMAGFLLAHPGFPAAGDRFWGPADWSWIGGLHDAVLAPWAAGGGVFAYERTGHFDPARAAALLAEHGVRNAFLPPTALRLWMRSGAPAPPLRTLHTAGEPLPALVHAWAAQAFGTAPREVYGLTECAFLLVNADAEPGVTGRVVPGREVRVRGEELEVRAGCPTMMLGYVEHGAARLPLRGGWLGTADHAREEQGTFIVLGRLDDVVKVSGYRVAPREVEEALLRHPAVEQCAVVGVPDAERGHVLRAVVRPAPGADRAALPGELRAWVRARLAAHQVPAEVLVVEELPTTATGKIVRRALRG